uniref:DNA-directed RNA polymerase n=1 Tax=Erythrotrichia carnea TaxID=35151 RepID=A0A1C9CE94_9RHOD|nr:RNA polymerase beta'' subunit [Erythrotrichia carnea]AOM66699.1 RNA polymerase beta'' subunit [Erythrotrichia carnea]
MRNYSDKDNLSPPFLNKIVNKKELKSITAWAFRQHGIAKASAMSDRLKELGFFFATKAGISLSLEDLRIPPAKNKLLEKTVREIDLTENRYARGEITAIERFQKVIDTWNNASESLKQEVVDYFKRSDPLNSVYMMAFSGARGNISQVRQLVGMRGLMSDPQGQIIDLPIASNFREGLTVTEHFISSYGARKGLVDTALRTADSGYLTRRLVDVAQDVIVREDNCHTHQGVLFSIPANKKGDISFFENLLLGRVLAEDIFENTKTHKVASANQTIDPQMVITLSNLDLQTILVRSPLTCESRISICQHCYGWNLAHGELVDLGEAVGIIAAQSIGEPGTQLTMRTFHTGGVFTGELSNQIKAVHKGQISLSKNITLVPTRTKHGDNAMKTVSNAELTLLDENKQVHYFSLKPNSILFIADGAFVDEGDILAELPIKSQFATEKAQKYLISDISGKIYFTDLIIEETNLNNNTTRTVKKEGLVWILASQIYSVPDSAEIMVVKQQLVQAGTILAQLRVVNKYAGLIRLPRKQTGNTDKKDIEIITDSILLKKSRLLLASSSNSEHSFVLETPLNQKFHLNVDPGSRLKHNQIIGCLDTDSYTTTTGGIVKYLDLSVTRRKTEHDGYDILGPGYLLWIPEETHEIDRDSSLLLVDNNQEVDSGTEIFKNIICSNSGVVSIKRKEDVVHEISIKPGYLHELSEYLYFKNKRHGFLRPGEIIEGDVITDKLVYWEYIFSNSKHYLLLRSVSIYTVPDNIPELEYDASTISSKSLNLNIARRILFKDGEKVKSIKGVELIKTYLTVQIYNSDPLLTTSIEFVKNKYNKSIFQLQILMVETLSVKQEVADNFRETNKITRILVQDNQPVNANSVIAKTEILCSSTGCIEEISGDVSKSSRIGVVTETDKVNIDHNNESLLVKQGDWIAQGDPVTSNICSNYSGLVLEIHDDYLVLRLGRPYLVSLNTILYVNNNDLIHYNEVLASLIFERTKTGDIVQGLPRIEEILEARKKTDGHFNPHKLLECLFFRYLLAESLNLYDAAKLSFQNLQLLLVNEIQLVYQSQNVDIANKHIEVIVKQMTSKVKIVHGGNTGYLPGELVELNKINIINNTMNAMSRKEAIYQPVLLGITKASLNTDSFISAASFQETTKVLTEAALSGKFDWLKGLKENVIIGRLIPAGTGFNTYYSDKTNVKNLVNTKKTSNYSGDKTYESTQQTDDIILDDRTARLYSKSSEVDISTSDMMLFDS